MDCVSSAAATENLEKTTPRVATESEHLRTDHLLQNLGTRAVSGGFMTAGAQLARFVVNLSAAAVLARLLNPQEFGLVGMVLGVTGLLGVFKELGLSTATVQRQVITQQQVSNLFWINVGISGTLSAVTLVLAPLVAWFYRDSRVAGIMMMLSLDFVLTGSTVQHQALLTRQMRFKALAIIDVASIVIGFGTACLLAWLGFGYWALVAQQLAVAATTLVFTWVISGWRPGLPTRNSGVRPLVSFGAHLTVADVIGRFTVNSDSILIGRFFGAVPLGFYSRANVLLARPLQQVLTPVSSVIIPVLSRLQSDPQRYRRTFMRAYETLALITFPLAAMCLVLAKPMVLFVLGPKWSGVIPLFSAFALVAVSLPLSIVPGWLFTSQGRGRDQFHTYSLAGAVTVGSYLVGLCWGPLGVILALAAAGLLIRMPILYHMAGRHGHVRSSDLWNGFFTHLPSWGTVYLATLAARSLVPHSMPIVQLLVCGPLGLGTGAAAMLLFPRPRQTASYAVKTLGKSLVQRWRNAV